MREALLACHKQGSRREKRRKRAGLVFRFLIARLRQYLTYATPSIYALRFGHLLLALE